ncbi:MAG: AraC family transcriptional regulator, partial [Akkermansiaceae bacterium]|nr:AraC family transcriptional regulator [Akkermansiaceae bacterium]
MRRLKIPAYPLTDYASADLAAGGVYVGRLEESLARRPNRVGLHRHDHFEIFWVQGTGIHFNDFQDYPLEGHTLVAVSSGQVHGWPDSGNLRGVMIGFTTAFFDGREPPPTTLMRYPFLWSGQPVLKLPDHPAVEFLVRLMEQESTQRRGDWQEVVRSGLRMILTLAARSASDGASQEPARAASLVLNFRSLLEERFRTTQA